MWIWGASVSGRLSDLGIPEEVQNLEVWKLTFGALSNAGFLKEHFNLLHLWFLHQLLSIYAVVLTVRHLFSIHLPGIKAIPDSLKQTMVTLIQSWNGIWIVSLMIATMLLTMDGWSVDTPNESALPHLGTTLIYGFFFMIGWTLHIRLDLLNLLSRRWPVYLVLALVLVWPSKNTTAILELTGLATSLGEYRRILFSLLYATMMTGFTFGLTGLFLHLADRQSSVWRYIADASYWIYLVHHLIIVPQQIIMADWNWPSGIKFLLINVVSFVILFFSYQYFVRYTWIGAALNGWKIKNAIKQTPQR